jgi:hypothetical protein
MIAYDVSKNHRSSSSDPLWLGVVSVCQHPSKTEKEDPTKELFLAKVLKFGREDSNKRVTIAIKASVKSSGAGGKLWQSIDGEGSASA